MTRTSKGARATAGEDPNGNGQAPQGRGRPRQLAPAEREEMILDAMERVLVRGGLHGASMAAIAREAGMSKRTLYRVFGSRADLFEACVRRIRATFVRPLRAEDRDLPVEARLTRLLAPDVGRPEQRARSVILHAVVAEAPRHPDLARAFLREGPEEARRLVRAELARALDRREIRVDDLDAAARLLLDMAHENPIDRLIDPPRPVPSPAESTARAELAVRVFLRGVGRGGG